MYDNGHGVTEDDEEAVRWYRLTAEQGEARAQSNLGLMYGTGEGVLQDDVEAVRWFRLAAVLGLQNQRRPELV
jgi:TPR repeat protein